MIMESQKNSLFIPVLVILAVLIIVGYFFFSRGNSDAVLESQIKTADEVIGKDLLLSLLKLKTIKLDDSLFKDKVFLSLQDWTIELVPQPVGRNNPFLPLGKNGPVVATTTVKAPVTTAPKPAATTKK